MDQKGLELQNSFQFSPTSSTGGGWVLRVVTPTWGEHRLGPYVQHEEITTWEMKRGEEKSYLYHW